MHVYILVFTLHYLQYALGTLAHVALHVCMLQLHLRTLRCSLQGLANSVGWNPIIIYKNNKGSKDFLGKQKCMELLVGIGVGIGLSCHLNSYKSQTIN